MDADQIKVLIANKINCSHLELSGDGRHWFSVIVSDAFEGKRLIARHQMVYASLGDKMKTDEIHALSIQAYTPAEWAQRQP